MGQLGLSDSKPEAWPGDVYKAGRTWAQATVGLVPDTGLYSKVGPVLDVTQSGLAHEHPLAQVLDWFTGLWAQCIYAW